MHHLLPYYAFLRAEKEQLTAAITLLEQQGCQDEANLQKIRLNIVGVFETVAMADEKHADTWQAFCQRYEPSFDTLRAPWQSRLAMAVAHDDIQTQTVEEAKLSTANHIKAVYLSLKE